MFFIINAICRVVLINVLFVILLVNSEEKCGKQTATSEGNTAVLGEFPWVALIRYKNNDGSDEGFKCAGILINSRYILTAATCTSSVGDWKVTEVRLGEHNGNTDKDCETTDTGEQCSDPIQEIAVEKIISHPNYNRRSSENDIALIRLAEDVKFTDYIQPICLPSTSDPTTVAKIGDTLFSTGWGVSHVTRERVASKKKVTGIFISNEECQKSLDNRKNITDNILCTQPLSSNVEYTCQGDSGGPVMYLSSNNRWYNQGIVSFGVGCGLNKYPDGNTNVVKYLDWIKENIKP